MVMIERPVFIVGCPRSGTTLLRRILDGHPSLAICRETQFHQLVYRRRKAFGDLHDPENRRCLVGEYLACRPMKWPEFETPEFKERLLRESISYREMFASILNHYADLQHKPRCGEKTPQHALFLETLCEWFPDATILHMVRDPRACVASLQRAAWSAFTSAVANTRRWIRFNEAARRFRDRAGYLEVRYEALVSDPAFEVRRICSFLGEEFAPSMLIGEENSSRLARAAVTASRVDAWRDQLTPLEVAQIEWVVGSRLEAFGYAREALPASAIAVLRGVTYAAFDFGRALIPRLPAVWYRFAAPARIASFEYWSGPKKWRKRANAEDGARRGRVSSEGMLK
jgi:hypothetical protein